MKQWKAAVFGTGFMGRVHTEAICRLGNVEVAVIASLHENNARRLADQFSVKRVEADYRKVLEDPSIDAVHICTPNAQHYPMAVEALEAGKHVVCEKPLATTVDEARALVAAAEKAGRRDCLNHNLRYYPLVQQIRQLREAGELGDILVAQGTYSQDWLLYDTDYNWRVEEKDGGALRCMADIGSHWFDMVEHLTGQRVTSLCADLHTFHKTRKKPKRAVETFAGKTLQPGDYDEVPITTDDYGGVVFRMGTAHGSMTASQVSGGRKNRLSIEVYGTKGSAAWDQEKPNELWLGHRNSNNQIIVKDPSLLMPGAQSYADLPGGHGEGYGDTFKQVFRRFYASLDKPEAKAEYPTFRDGLRQLQIMQAEMESQKSRAWVDLPAHQEAKV
jgi:predicted dehydrogenase